MSTRRKWVSSKRNHTTTKSPPCSSFVSETTESVTVSTDAPTQDYHDLRVVKFIRSQKKCAQLVYGGYIYNRKIVQQNGRTTWRCSDLTKYHCNATCVTKLNQLVSARRQHNHGNHASKICMKSLFDYPEDLEEYLDIYTRDPIDPSNQQVDVIDADGEFKVVLRDNSDEHQHHQQAIEIEEEEDDDEHN